MTDIFFSYVEEDATVAFELVHGLEAIGYGCWHYKRDSNPGISYFEQIDVAIEGSKAVVLLGSPRSIGSEQVTNEVVNATERSKGIIPVLLDLTHEELQEKQRSWRAALGARVSIPVSADSVAAAVPRIVAGLKALGITPDSAFDPSARTGTAGPLAAGAGAGSRRGRVRPLLFDRLTSARPRGYQRVPTRIGGGDLGRDALLESVRTELERLFSIRCADASGADLSVVDYGVPPLSDAAVTDLDAVAAELQRRIATFEPRLVEPAVRLVRQEQELRVRVRGVLVGQSAQTPVTVRVTLLDGLLRRVEASDPAPHRDGGRTRAVAPIPGTAP